MTDGFVRIGISVGRTGGLLEKAGKVRRIGELVNQLLGEERQLVDARAGTTQETQERQQGTSLIAHSDREDIEE